MRIFAHVNLDHALGLGQQFQSVQSQMPQALAGFPVVLCKAVDSFDGAMVFHLGTGEADYHVFIFLGRQNTVCSDF
ncbi:MAG: hypothetical protein B7X93_07970 [Hydrogenophilales bacterium 17-61-9]|nr:MAG: hypothetical protein B7X93_07970 [Hydrogenophilales bacterium 17-61-9]